jgi:hypothetical protein
LIATELVLCRTRGLRAERRCRRIQGFAWIRRLPDGSGKRGLAVENEHGLVVRQARSKGVVLGLEPGKLGFQVANTLLETTHFGEHTRIGSADVTE